MYAPEDHLINPSELNIIQIHRPIINSPTPEEDNEVLHCRNRRVKAIKRYQTLPRRSHLIGGNRSQYLESLVRVAVRNNKIDSASQAGGAGPRSRVELVMLPALQGDVLADEEALVIGVAAGGNGGVAVVASPVAQPPLPLLSKPPFAMASVGAGPVDDDTALALDGTLDDDTGALEDALGVIDGSRERLLDVELGTLERTLEGPIEALLEALLDGSAEEILADIETDETGVLRVEDALRAELRAELCRMQPRRTRRGEASTDAKTAESTAKTCPQRMSS